MALCMAYIDQLIMFAAGFWMTATGFGFLEFVTQQDWQRNLVRHFRWVGPLLIAISIILLFGPKVEIKSEDDRRGERDVALRSMILL